jgi:hypothetical protein
MYIAFGDPNWTIDISQTPLVNFKFWGANPGEAAPLGVLLNRALLFIFPMAGLILFGIIIASGFQLMTSAGNPEKMKKAQGQLTMGVIGFIIIFVAYWLIQILDAILGLHYFTP